MTRPVRSRSRPLRARFDGNEDRGFWQPIEATPEFGTPLYYRAHLMRKPEMAAAAVKAVANAQPGGVAFHASAGATARASWRWSCSRSRASPPR